MTPPLHPIFYKKNSKLEILIKDETQRSEGNETNHQLSTLRRKNLTVSEV